MYNIKKSKDYYKSHIREMTRRHSFQDQSVKKEICWQFKIFDHFVILDVYLKNLLNMLTISNIWLCRRKKDFRKQDFSSTSKGNFSGIQSKIYWQFESFVKKKSFGSKISQWGLQIRSVLGVIRICNAFAFILREIW